MEIIATREKRDVLPYYIPYFGGLGSNRIRTEAAEKIKKINYYQYFIINTRLFL
jgi:hypothetical protein